MQSKNHWEQVYETRQTTEVSWYQPHAEHSLDLIRRIGLAPDAAIIDVGGGASTLVDDLLGRGYRNLSVLDLSSAALMIARAAWTAWERYSVDRSRCDVRRVATALLRSLARSRGLSFPY